MYGTFFQCFGQANSPSLIVLRMFSQKIPCSVLTHANIGMRSIGMNVDGMCIVQKKVPHFELDMHNHLECTFKEKLPYIEPS